VSKKRKIGKKRKSNLRNKENHGKYSFGKKFESGNQRLTLGPKSRPAGEVNQGNQQRYHALRTRKKLDKMPTKIQGVEKRAQNENSNSSRAAAPKRQ